MSNIIFVDEETYKQIVTKAKFIPENLKINTLIPKGQAIVVDMNLMPKGELR